MPTGRITRSFKLRFINALRLAIDASNIRAGNRFEPVNALRLDAWAASILTDPLSKEPLKLSPDGLRSPYGKTYPVNNGVPDLRLVTTATTTDQKVWREGQVFYERWADALAGKDSEQGYIAEREGVREVYQEIPIVGRCLDVGGGNGRLRAFLEPGQPYITCDPYMGAFRDIDKQKRLLAAYPCLRAACNFVCAQAEFLPFKSQSFDCVHMRSVIDHLLSPELALREAYRVLDSSGYLVVGLYVRGGRSGRVRAKEHLKEAVKNALALAFPRFRDPHVWHPTYAELVGLITSCGFEVARVHWQKGYNETVCYVKAAKV